MTEFEFVKTSQRGRIYEITIDHPPVNALNRQTYDELRAAFAEVATMTGTNVVVVSGAGRGFCPGADINDVLHDVTEEARRSKFVIVDDMVENLVQIPVPVIAKIHGFCLAAGMRIASYCDIRVASEEAIFGMPEVDRGLTAGSGGSLRRLNLPGGLVREMIFTGARYSARQMLDAGFLHGRARTRGSERFSSTAHTAEPLTCDFTHIRTGGLGELCAYWPGIGHRAAGRVVVVGQVDPAGRGGFLDRHLYTVVGGWVACGIVPDDLVEEPRRGDDRQHARGGGQGGFERVCLKQPERQVDCGCGGAVPVIPDLSGMECHPQPYLLGSVMGAVMPAEFGGQGGRERFGEELLGHLGGNQDEYAVAAVLAIAAGPGDSCLAERALHGLVQPVPDSDLVPAGASFITEPLDVNHGDAPVNRAVPGSRMRDASGVLAGSGAPAVTEHDLQQLEGFLMPRSPAEDSRENHQ